MTPFGAPEIVAGLQIVIQFDAGSPGIAWQDATPVRGAFMPVYTDPLEAASIIVDAWDG